MAIGDEGFAGKQLVSNPASTVLEGVNTGLGYALKQRELDIQTQEAQTKAQNLQKDMAAMDYAQAKDFIPKYLTYYQMEPGKFKEAYGKNLVKTYAGNNVVGNKQDPKAGSELLYSLINDEAYGKKIFDKFNQIAGLDDGSPEKTQALVQIGYLLGDPGKVPAALEEQSKSQRTNVMAGRNEENRFQIDLNSAMSRAASSGVDISPFIKEIGGHSDLNSKKEVLNRMQTYIGEQAAKYSNKNQKIRESIAGDLSERNQINKASLVNRADKELESGRLKEIDTILDAQNKAAQIAQDGLDYFAGKNKTQVNWPAFNELLQDIANTIKAKPSAVSNAYAYKSLNTKTIGQDVDNIRSYLSSAPVGGPSKDQLKSISKLVFALRDYNVNAYDKKLNEVLRTQVRSKIRSESDAEAMFNDRKKSGDNSKYIPLSQKLENLNNLNVPQFNYSADENLSRQQANEAIDKARAKGDVNAINNIKLKFKKLYGKDL